MPTSPMPGRFPLIMPAPGAFAMRVPPRNHSASQLAALEHGWSSYVVGPEGLPMAIYPMHARMAMSVPTSPRVFRGDPPGAARGPSPRNATRSPSPTHAPGRPSFAAAAALPELPRGNGVHARSVGSPQGGRGSERGRASEPGSFRGASWEPAMRGRGRGGAAGRPRSAGLGSEAGSVAGEATPGTPPGQQLASSSFVLADEDFPVLGGSGTPGASKSPPPGEWAARAKPSTK